jgi:plastocyanin
MDELTARLQRAATELAERAVVPAPDDIVRRGRRQRRRHAAGAVLLVMALAGAVVTVPLLRPWEPAAPTGMPPATPSPSPLAPGHRCSARVTTAQLTAKNITFAPACLAAVAGRPFRLTFDNKEAVPHNVSIFEGPDANSRQVFTRPPFPGPRVETYQIPALSRGSHFFRCDVHPNLMQGQLIVR